MTGAEDRAATLLAQWIGAGRDGEECTRRLGALMDSVSHDAAYLSRILLEAQMASIIQGGEAVAITDADWLVSLRGQDERMRLVIRVLELVVGSVRFPGS